MIKGKAAGVDGIPMETQLYGGETVRKVIKLLKRELQKEEVISREWKMSVVVPIYKKEDSNRTENYRGISLLCTAYKVYAEVLKIRIERDCEGLNIIPVKMDSEKKKERWIMFLY